MNGTIEHIVAYCRANFDLATIKDSEYVGYNTLTLCIVDSVFSIGIRYTIVENVIKRFQQHFPPERQTLGHLLEAYSIRGVEGMANDVFCNRNRTSPRSGILKAEAVLRFASVVSEFGAKTTLDALMLINNSKFEDSIMAIPGQREGISLAYFYMLAGEKNMVKPDRMISRFLNNVTGHHYSSRECQQMVIQAAAILSQDYPHLTTRALDFAIWSSMTQK